MTAQKKHEVKLLEDKRIRTAWDPDAEKWYFSVVDVVGVLTESANPANYWKVLKNRIRKEAGQSVTICNQLKMPSSDGKSYRTDVADQAQLFRIIQIVPSKKAEPFKQWMAAVASMRIDQLQDPELSINQAISDYRRLGYSDRWIAQRIETIRARKELKDEWHRSGVSEGAQFTALTDVITKTWSGKTTREYKALKGLRKESLRDNMTTMELALNMLAEASTAEISRVENPFGFYESARVASKGGEIAHDARIKIEAQTGKKVVTAAKASDYLPNGVGEKPRG